MKRTLILLIVFTISTQIHMYAGDTKSYIGLRGGVSIPTGKYASLNLNDGSFTLTGFSMGIEGVWFFHKRIGAGMDFNFSLHPVDASALATATVVEDPFMEDLTIRSDPYNIKTYMAGFFYQIPIANKLIVTPKLLTGIMFGRTPFQLYEAEYFMIGPHYYKITESRDHNLAIKGGANFTYSISDCISLGLNIDYTYSKLIFGFQTSSGLESRERKIGYLDMGLNLQIKF